MALCADPRHSHARVPSALQLEGLTTYSEADGQGMYRRVSHSPSSAYGMLVGMW